LAKRETRFDGSGLPAWAGWVAFGALLMVAEVLNLPVIYLAGRGTYTLWHFLILILIFNASLVSLLAFLRERVPATRSVAAAMIALGAFTWFLAFSHVGPFETLGPLGPGELPGWAATFLLDHPFTLGALQFSFFIGIALLLPRRARTGEEGAARSSWFSSGIWLLVLIPVYLLTAETSPLSILSAAGATGDLQPVWIAANRVDLQSFILNPVVILSFLAVYRSVATNRRVALPWIGAGAALILLSILSASSGASAQLLALASDVAFWFGPTSTAGSTLLTIGVLSILLRPLRVERTTSDE